MSQVAYAAVNSFGGSSERMFFPKVSVLAMIFSLRVFSQSRSVSVVPVRFAPTKNPEANYTAFVGLSTTRAPVGVRPESSSEVTSSKSKTLFQSSEPMSCLSYSF